MRPRPCLSLLVGTGIHIQRATPPCHEQVPRWLALKL